MQSKANRKKFKNKNSHVLSTEKVNNIYPISSYHLVNIIFVPEKNKLWQRNTISLKLTIGIQYLDPLNHAISIKPQDLSWPLGQILKPPPQPLGKGALRKL